MTLFEVWKYLLVSNGDEYTEPVRLEDVAEALETEELRKRVVSSHGFYFLRGREELIIKRISRSRRSILFTKRARRLARFLRNFPFVCMVGLTGSVAMKNARRGSDWDLLISLKPGHIWTGRLVVTSILHMFGLRRHGVHVSERACLNYWVTSDSLEVFLKDVFSSHEYTAAIPLFGVEEYQRFRLRNIWIRNFRPNYAVTNLLSLWCLPDTTLAAWVRRIGETLLDFSVIEAWARRVQKFKIEHNPKTRWSGSLVIARDQALVFLPKPRGPRIFEKFKRRLSEVEANV